MHSRLLPSALCLLACNANTGDSTDDTATTTLDTTGTPTTGTPEICEMYASDELGPSVQISVRNTTDGPVWVPRYGCGIPDVNIVDPADAGASNRFYAPRKCSPITCQDFVGNDDCQLECDECEEGIAIRIEAGKSITFDWVGGYATEMTMSSECASGIQCADETCDRPTKAPPAAYAVSIRAYVSCVYNCECDPSPEGWCPVPGDSIQFIEDGLEPTVMLDYPNVTTLEILITNP